MSSRNDQLMDQLARKALIIELKREVADVSTGSEQGRKLAKLTAEKMEEFDLDYTEALRLASKENPEMSEKYLADVMANKFNP